MGDRVRSTIRDYVNCGIIFFKAYCLVNFLKENEKKKVEEDLGYVKKEFKDELLPLIAKEVEQVKVPIENKQLKGVKKVREIRSNMIKATRTFNAGPKEDILELSEFSFGSSEAGDNFLDDFSEEMPGVKTPKQSSGEGSTKLVSGVEVSPKHLPSVHELSNKLIERVHEKMALEVSKENAGTIPEPTELVSNSKSVERKTATVESIFKQLEQNRVEPKTYKRVTQSVERQPRWLPEKDEGLRHRIRSPSPTRRRDPSTDIRARRFQPYNQFHLKNERLAI